MQDNAVSYQTFVEGNTRIELNESSVADSGYSLLSDLLFPKSNQRYSARLPVAIENVKLLYMAR
jgi:hypothetical protein